MVVEQPGRPTNGSSDPFGARARAAAIAKHAVTSLGLKRPAKMTLRVYRDLRSRIKPALKRMAAAAGLSRQATAVWRCAKHSFTRLRPHSDSAAAALGSRNAAFDNARGKKAGSLESTYISLGDLDILLSFECFEAIWDWPTEHFKCRLIGVFHDAIPLRINEGIPQSSHRYYVAAGKMAQRAHLIACDSHSSLQDLHTYFPNSKAKSCVVHLGHDRDRFLPAPQSASSKRIFKLGRGKRTTKTIVMIGEIEPRKNQSSVFRACRQLAALYPSERISLLLIGKLSEHYSCKVLEQQVPNNVEIDRRGYIPDQEVGDLLRRSDVFVFASLWEGFGIPVLEAMSAGIPVVCSENSSLTEVGGPWAFYCDPYDPASIAAAVKRALDLTSARRDRWVAEARAWAEQFTWERCARQFEQLCLQTANRGERPEAREALLDCANSTCSHPTLKRERRQLRPAS
ncbi:MAG TPA: glycosyltransferase family 1 protein [Pirellulales bacterium]|nr:glycosyltransferase family 1 protein [Pirellulales bacterium]